MKGILCALILAFAPSAKPVRAKFGGIVLDPTQAAHAAQQLIQGSQLYTTTIKTTQNVMEAYNLAQRMATAPLFTNSHMNFCTRPSGAPRQPR